MIKFEGLPEDTKLNNKIKYAVEQIKLHWNKPQWWKGRLMTYVVKNIVNKWWEGRYSQEKIVSVMKEDWDNLIILDACRYNTFIEIYGECDYRISKGSSTIEFLRENFSGKKFLDTVYVTANPFVNRFSSSFYKVVSVWKDGWSDDLGTVLPEVMVEYTLEAEVEYPNKRLIIHFIQPHYPYIGDIEINKVTYTKNHFSSLASGINVPDVPIEQFLKNNIKEFKKAYKKTLKLVLPHALKLAKKLEGKTVITADHGEAFGEFAWPFPIRIYGHPSHVHIPVLVKVPWLVIEKGERREIRAGDERQKIKERIKRLKKTRKI